MTCYSGRVDENDLAYECFPPYSLNDVFGVKTEETDSIWDGEYNTFTYQGKQYMATTYFDLQKVCGAEILAAYECDFYKGMPAVSRHGYGKGQAYYIACRTDTDFLYDFYREWIQELEIEKNTEDAYVDDVMVKAREKDGKKYVFYMNFSDGIRRIEDMTLDAYQWRIRNY